MNKQEIEQLVEAKVKSILAQAFGIANTTNTDIEYLSSSQAWKVFGYKSQRQLYTAIESGLLRVGKEVQDRRTANSTKAVYYFNKQACLKRFNELPEKRAMLREAKGDLCDSS